MLRIFAETNSTKKYMKLILRLERTIIK